MELKKLTQYINFYYENNKRLEDFNSGLETANLKLANGFNVTEKSITDTKNHIIELEKEVKFWEKQIINEMKKITKE